MTTSDDEHAADEAAEAEEERLDREVPSALDTLSRTARKFLDDPGVDLAAAVPESENATDEEPPQDGDPTR